MLEVHNINDADSIFPHRQRFELFGKLNIKARLTKMNIIFFGIWLQMLFQLNIILGVDTCLMCFIIVFCSFRVERYSTTLFSICKNCFGIAIVACNYSVCSHIIKFCKVKISLLMDFKRPHLSDGKLSPVFKNVGNQLKTKTKFPNSKF